LRPASWFPLLILVGLTVAGCGAASTTKSTATTATTATTSAPTTVPATIAQSGPLHFSGPRPLAQGAGLASVSCGSATSCMALDSKGRAYHFDGTSWSSPVPPTAQAMGSGALSVSCAPTFCVAIATAGNQVVTWNGQTWSPPITLTGANGLEGVGCAPTGYCAAVDAEGYAYSSDGGLAWQGTSGDWGSVSAISCVSSSFCVSVSGGISQWNGDQWTQPTPYGSTASFAGVSCPTAAFCMAVDQSGQALQWNGQSWSALVRIEPGQPSTNSIGVSPTGVSCPTAGYCAAVDDSGGVIQWSNGTWTRSDVDAGVHLMSISCPTVSFCVAVDQSGNVLVGTP